MKFTSFAEMQNQLEKIDIENDEYSAWDRTGAPLKLSVQKPVWLTLQPQSTEYAATDLKDALRAYASSLGVNVTIEETTVAAIDSAYEEIERVRGKRRILGNLFGRKRPAR